MSTTVIAVIVQLLVVILPVFGVKVGSAELTNAAQTIITIITGLIVWYQHVKNGNLTFFGGVKK